MASFTKEELDELLGEKAQYHEDELRRVQEIENAELQRLLHLYEPMMMNWVRTKQSPMLTIVFESEFKAKDCVATLCRKFSGNKRTLGYIKSKNAPKTFRVVVLKDEQTKTEAMAVGVKVTSCQQNHLPKDYDKHV
jgi:hypothetical protein